MANASNNGNLVGRLAGDPRSFANQDGSKKVVFTLYAERGYKKDGKNVSDQISVEAFISNKTNGNGPFDHVHQGDLVALSTHIEQQPYIATNGEKVFPAAKIVIDDIQFLESRTVTQGRLAKRTVEGGAAEGAATAEAPAAEGATDYENDTPFAEAAAS